METRLRSLSPDGKELPVPLELPSRCQSPILQVGVDGNEDTESDEYKSQEEHPHSRATHNHDDREQHEQQDQPSPPSPQRATAMQTMDFVHSSVSAKLSLGGSFAAAGGDDRSSPGDDHIEGGEDDDDYADAYDDFEDYDDDEGWEEDDNDDDGAEGRIDNEDGENAAAAQDITAPNLMLGTGLIVRTILLATVKI